jgi:hypothetical protein
VSDEAVGYCLKGIEGNFFGVYDPPLHYFNTPHSIDEARKKNINKSL